MPLLDFIVKVGPTLPLTQKELIALGLLAQHESLTANSTPAASTSNKLSVPFGRRPQAAQCPELLGSSPDHARSCWRNRLHQARPRRLFEVK